MTKPSAVEKLSAELDAGDGYKRGEALHWIEDETVEFLDGVEVFDAE